MVLFNRFFHPSFDIEKETSEFPFNLSTSNDHRLPLRFVGLMYDRVKASVCGSNGIHTAEDAVEMLLAGANAFQAVSTMYLNGSKVISDIILGINEWMDRKGYESLDQFRGKLSEQNHEDRFAYRRAQYVKMLLRSDEFLRRPNLI
jgi:dihydroorotate dehydrogenase (fumarate)